MPVLRPPTSPALTSAGYAHVLVQAGTNAVINGQRLVAAYSQAAAMTPGGAAKSAKNFAVVVLTPGEYWLEKTSTSPGLDITAEFTGIVGLGAPGAVRIVSGRPGHTAETGPILRQSARTVRLENFGIHEYTYEVSSPADGWKSPGLDIVNTSVLGSTASCTTNAAALINGANPFGNVLAGDVVEVVSGAGITRRQCYRVALWSTAGLIVLDGSPGDSAGDVTVVIRRPNTNSTYRNLVITGEDHVFGGYADIYSAGSIGGTWENCRCHKGGWRVGEYQSLFATMRRCYGGEGSYGGDGGGIILGYNNAVTCTLDGSFEYCDGSDTCFGGCNSFGGHIGTLARFKDCHAGSNSYGVGRTCAGTFYGCTGGDNSFGGTADSPDSQYGTFSGLAVNCSASKRCFGGGHTSAKFTGTLFGCRATGLPDTMVMFGGQIENSRVQVTGTNKHCLTITDSNSSILNSTLIANGNGNGIYAAGALNVVSVGNRMNLAKHANVTELVEGATNVVNSLIT